MITFFTSCRPFEDEFEEIQLQAIASWEAAVPGCEVLNLSGTARVNKYGTALVSSLFEIGDRMAKHNLLCEISSDILLTDDFLPALRVIQGVRRPFVVGQRWDLGPDGGCNVHPPTAMDYFIFYRGTLGKIPPFAVGRTVYDNWLPAAADKSWGLTLIDATESITALHQNHSYPEYGNRVKMLQSEEKETNVRLAHKSNIGAWYNVDHAPFVLRDGEVKKR